MKTYQWFAVISAFFLFEAIGAYTRWCSIGMAFIAGFQFCMAIVEWERSGKKESKSND